MTIGDTVYVVLQDDGGISFMSNEVRGFMVAPERPGNAVAGREYVVVRNGLLVDFKDCYLDYGQASEAYALLKLTAGALRGSPVEAPPAKKLRRPPQARRRED